MSSLPYLKVKLFWLLLTELLNYVWSKCTHKGRMKCQDERDITGQVVIVTGANSGIGKEVSYEFSIRKARVIMACRNLNEGHKAIEEHRKRAISKGISMPLNLTLLHLDLMDFESVRKFCAEVNSTFGKVNVLVNNAGIFDTSGILRRTKDGFEEHIVVNYLSQFLLTNLLLDALKPGESTSSASRVIDVSSSLQWYGVMKDETNLFLQNEPKTSGVGNALPYGLSKFYMSLFSKEMSRRVREKQTLFYSMCPGFVDTGIFRSFNGFRKCSANIVLSLAGVPLSVGCDTILFLALSKVPPKNGLFYRFDKVRTPIEKNLDDNNDFAKKLVSASCNVVGVNELIKI